MPLGVAQLPPIGTPLRLLEAVTVTVAEHVHCPDLQDLLIAMLALASGTAAGAGDGLGDGLGLGLGIGVGMVTVRPNWPRLP